MSTITTQKHRRSSKQCPRHTRWLLRFNKIHIVKIEKLLTISKSVSFFSVVQCPRSDLSHFGFGHYNHCHVTLEINCWRCPVSREERRKTVLYTDYSLAVLRETMHYFCKYLYELSAIAGLSCFGNLWGIFMHQFVLGWALHCQLWSNAAFLPLTCA